MTQIALENVSYAIDGATLLDGVSATLEPGAFVAIVGPNGAGKTTLMKCAVGALTPTAGRARIGADDAAALNAQARARAISYLPQHSEAAWPVRVDDIVALGRYAYGAGRRLDAAGRAAVDRAIAQCGLDPLRQRRIDSLSGGEKARVHCARAFAAEAPFLFADEPTASLDPAGRLAVAGLIGAQTRRGVGACVILHDVNLAAAFADRLIWMKGGKIVADGPPSQTMTPALFRRVFDVSVRIESGDAAPVAIFSREPVGSREPGASAETDAMASAPQRPKQP